MGTETKKKVPGLRIIARPAQGFRRAGIHHPPTPVDHPRSRFTAAQVRELRGERNLIVVDVDLAAPAGDEAGDGTEG